MSSEPYVLSLSDIPLNSRALVGGKALELAALHRLGLRVPPAFVVTTHAYTDGARHNTPLPAPIRSEIAAAFHALVAGIPRAERLIVRSSAPFEDSAAFSAAGQLASIVCRAELDEVMAAIQACWSAGQHPALLDYYRYTGGHGLPDLAVIVQAWVDSDVSGVMFTRGIKPHPAALVIEAVWGASLGLTAGVVTPDRYVVDRDSGQIIQVRHAPGAPVRTTVDDCGNMQQIPAPDLTGQPVLDQALIGQLVRAARTIEAYYGAPQDIEWAITRGQLTILQTRPITVSVEAESFFTTPGREPDTIWTAGFFEERFPQAVSPLTWTFLFPLIEQIALREPLRFAGVRKPEQMQLLRLYRGHIYTNMAVFQKLYKFFPDALLPHDARRFFPGGDVQRRRNIPHPRFYEFVWGVLRTVLTEGRWHPFNHLLWRRFVKRYRRRLAGYRAQSECSLAPDELLRLLTDINDLTRPLLRLHRWSLVYAEVFSTLLARLVRRWAGIPPERVQTYLVSAAESPTYRTDRALWALAQRAVSAGMPADEAAETAETRPDLAAAMRDFLAKFGHRSFCLDLICPRYADDPAQVWQIVAGLMRQPDSRRVDKQTEHDRVQHDLSGQLRRGVVPFKRWIIGLLIRFARPYVALREEQRFEWQKALALMRQLFTHAAGDLVMQGYLRHTSDVFFLTWDEFCRLMHGEAREESWAAVLAARRRQFRRVQYAPYPRFLQGDVPLDTPVAFTTTLHGVGASAGQATGTARVIPYPDSLADLLHRLHEGDILVTHATDPGWTPAFGKIRGLVMRVGGQLSHGAIVAREYGLPAVVSLEDGFTMIQDGASILVDGDAGTVTLLSSSHAD